MEHVHVTSPDFWRLLEPIHAVVYFAPEPLAGLRAAGYRGFWMGYFAGRAAPLGAASPELVHALFYNFDYRRVSRALPDAWSYAPPGGRPTRPACRVGLGVAPPARRTGRRGPYPHRSRPRGTSRPTRAARGTAALRGKSIPPDTARPLARLWHAATLLREHRGDGHVSTLTHAGISGRTSHILHAIATGTPKSVYERARDFDDHQWQTEVDSLRNRGYLDSAGGLTAEGAAAKADVEARTDALASAAYNTLSGAELDQLRQALRPITRAAVDAKDIPTPSPMGLDLTEALME
jgi:hypothetical protein